MKSRCFALSLSIRTLSLARCTLALLSILVARHGYGGNTALVLDSPQGDWVGDGESWYYTAPNASFVATKNAHNGVSIELHMGAECWSLNFAAPNMIPLTVGLYEHATRYPFEVGGSIIPYDAGLDVAGGHFCSAGHGCNTLRGSFVVTELVWGDNGSVTSFHASFVQNCEEFNPSLQGEVFFNSNAPIPPPHHFTGSVSAFGTEGQSFRYQITTNRLETLYTATALPAGLALDPNTGLISGRPEEQGQFKVTLTASGQSGSASATVTLSIDPPGRSTGPFTAVSITSEVGEPLGGARNIFGTEAIFAGYYRRAPGYSMKLTVRPLSMFSPPFDRSNEVYIEMDAPGTAPLVPGHYIDIDPNAWGGPGPQIWMEIGYTPTFTAMGTFDINELWADPNGYLEHLHASFIQYGNGSSSPMRGWVWYKAENVITSCPFASGNKGTPFVYQIVANNHPLSYSCDDLPLGLLIDPQSGRITGTPAVHGSYNVTASAVGPTVLASEKLWFKINPAQTLANISTRAKIGAGDNSLIGGFILEGQSNKRVIVRAIGPSLSGVGLNDPLSDPLLELRDGAGVSIAANDDWRANQAEVEATGLAPTDDRESAIVANLPSGNFTAVVTGKGGATGVGLVEVYDITPSWNAHLANVSTRCFVDVGENVLIGGFILGFGTAGDHSRVLVKGLGPSLIYFDIQNYLRDPILELHNINGTIVSSNDDWRTTQEAEIQATGLAPRDDLESALITTLTTGPYTPVVRGKDGGMGVALVEVYQLDN